MISWATQNRRSELQVRRNNTRAVALYEYRKLQGYIETKMGEYELQSKRRGKDGKTCACTCKRTGLRRGTTRLVAPQFYMDALVCSARPSAFFLRMSRTFLPRNSF